MVVILDVVDGTVKLFNGVQLLLEGKVKTRLRFTLLLGY
jgi:hypothetical protein